jgi:hypothetical protein
MKPILTKRNEMPLGRCGIIFFSVIYFRINSIQPEFGLIFPEPSSGSGVSPVMRLITILSLMAITIPLAKAENTNSVSLTLTIQCTNNVFKMGDKIPVEFVISNGGTADYTYANRTYDRSGRIDEYELTVKSSCGKTLPPLNYGGLAGGLFQTAILHPGQIFIKTIPLNLWVVPPSPGQYTITGIYHGSFGNPTQQLSGICSGPITATILPRSEVEMDAYINNLTNHGGVDWMKLAFTGSQKTVPCLLNGMYHGGDSFWIAKALVVYLPHTDSIKQQIIETALKEGLADNMVYVLQNYQLSNREWVRLIARSLREDSPGTWEAGARAAVPGHFDDTLTSRLIAIANGNSGARDQAILALAMNRTSIAVRTLKTLLENPDKEVRLATEEAICVAYCSRGYYHGEKLKPDDFDKKFQEPSTYLNLVQGKSE